MRYIQRDGYYAIDWPDRLDLYITEICDQFPEIIIGNYLVNTSFDSGSLDLVEEEKEEGWFMVGNLAHSPRISSVNQLPHDQYDEWLVFENPTTVDSFETFVSWGGFTPLDFFREEEKEYFWKQILRLRPLHILDENDYPYFITRDALIAQKVIASEQ